MGLLLTIMQSPPTNLNPVAVLAALGSANRLQMVALMARGEAQTINGLVQATGRSYKAVHKDLTVLWSSGAVAVRFGDDKRVGLYHIAEQYHPQPGVVDYGFCAVRFGDAAKLPENIATGKD
jgi:hypothetical protein